METPHPPLWGQGSDLASSAEDDIGFYTQTSTIIQSRPWGPAPAHWAGTTALGGLPKAPAPRVFGLHSPEVDGPPSPGFRWGRAPGRLCEGTAPVGGRAEVSWATHPLTQFPSPERSKTVPEVPGRLSVTRENAAW